MVFPGFPQIKLWPDMLASLEDDPDKLPRFNPSLEKRAWPAAYRFPLMLLSPKRIYVLDEGNAVEILPLGPHDALAELICHTYGAMGVGSSTHLLECTSIVNKVTVCRLGRQKSLSQLPQVARLIEEDLARSTEPVGLSNG